ncbi:MULTISPECIES: TRAP transporter substrate-binding protein [Roseobacteraceae]|uniref:TRAP transporter substrate-binding protein n=1 Tax=Roseobacteraceae TaxID=2854170 RepID=UPI00125F8E25|nr:MULTISPECIES: TRAP transporter substrate-binding protein [Roseobacteraceae]KAB6715124.1 ABC transporter substrate-binding protein [Roseobacter sp. TSBP12]
MDRRSFLKTSALGGASAAAAGLAAPAVAQGAPRTLTMVCSWPRGLAGVWDAVERFVDNVQTMSGGSLAIDARAAGELVGGLEVFDAVTAGQADMYHAADYYFTGQHPAWAYYTTAPFGMTAPEMMSWYYGMGGKDLHQQLGDVFGLHTSIAGQTGAQGGGWFRKEIKSVADFQGLKFRMPGLGGEVVGKLGASVQVMAAGEIYQALSSGALDGTEWVGPWSDEKLGLQEVCQFFYPAGFHEPGSALSVNTNLEVFDSLSPAEQRILDVAAAECHQFDYALFIANNGPALGRLISGGTQIKEFSDDVWDAYGAASKEVLDQYMGDEIFAETRAAYESAMGEISGWTGRSDSVYTAQRNRVLGLL